MLPDHMIRSLNLVTPFREELLQPASYDLTLGPTCLTFRPVIAGRRFLVGTHKPNMERHDDWDVWQVRPGELVLFQTSETMHIPADIAGKFEGKSSLGRIGLMTHITAGFIDPGFEGVLTLEVYNCGPHNLYLPRGMRIGQVSFTRLESAVERPYGSLDLGSHYQHSETVVEGKFDDCTSKPELGSGVPSSEEQDPGDPGH